MSNIAIFNQAPTFLKDQVEANDLDNLASGQSVAKVVVKPSGITVVEDGNILAKSDANGVLPVVIVGASPVGRSYYASAYDKESSEQPDCSSYDGVVPDEWVKHKQSAKCETCPQNIKGSSPTSAGSKACRYHQNLALVSPAVPDKLLRLRLPATGIFSSKEKRNEAPYSLKDYAAWVKANGQSLLNVVTEVLQNPRSDYAVAAFQARDLIRDEALYNRVLEHRESDELDYVLGKRINAVNIDAGAPALAAPPAPAQAAQPAAAPPAKPATPVEYKSVDGVSYQPYEPISTADEVTYWMQGSVVIKLAPDVALPTEDWVECTQVEYDQAALNADKKVRRPRRQAPDKPVVEEATVQARPAVSTPQQVMAEQIGGLNETDDLPF